MVAAVIVAALVAASPAVASHRCKATQLAWGSSCWSYRTGQGPFARWLLDHGADPVVWSKRHPRQAERFGRYWPPTRATVLLAVRDRFGAHAAQARAIAWCESRWWPYAVGAAGERGPFQIHPVHYGWVDEERLWDPWYSAQVAWRLSQGGTDWSPWTCSRL